MNVTGLCGSFHPKKVRDGAALLGQARRLCSPVGSLSSGQGVGQRASKIGDRPKPNKGTAKHTAGRSSRLHQTSDLFQDLRTSFKSHGVSGSVVGSWFSLFEGDPKLSMKGIELSALNSNGSEAGPVLEKMVLLSQRRIESLIKRRQLQLSGNEPSALAGVLVAAALSRNAKLFSDFFQLLREILDDQALTQMLMRELVVNRQIFKDPSSLADMLSREGLSVDEESLLSIYSQDERSQETSGRTTRSADAEGSEVGRRTSTSAGREASDGPRRASALPIVPKNLDCSKSQLIRGLTDQSVFPSKAYFTKLMLHYTRTGRVLDALKLYNLLDFDPRLVSSAMTVLCMKCLLRQGRTHQVLRVYMNTKSMHKPDVHTFSVLIDACATMGDLENLEKALREMESCKVVPNAITITSIMKGYSKPGKRSDVVKYARELSSKYNIAWDVKAYTSAIKACGAAGDLSGMKSLYSEMTESAGLQPNLICYTTLIHGFAKAGDCKNAVRIFMEMESRGIEADSYALSVLMYAFAKVGDVQGALKYLEESQRRGIQSSDYMFSTLIQAFIESNEHSGAVRTYETLKAKGFSCNLVVRTSVLNAYSYLGDFEEAEKIFQEMRQDGLLRNIVQYTSMMRVYRRQGKTVETIALHDEMTDKGIAPDGRSLTYLIKALHEADLLDKASVKVNYLFRDDQNRGAYWTSLMLIAALRKDLNQVTVTMERATTAGWGKDAELCRSYIIALWDCGEADTAANALATMLKTRASLSAPKEFRILAQVRTAELVLHRNPTIFRYAERADTALLGFDQPRPYAYRKG
uniref:Pentacotripeptide-repeat region of PRORP domain-containing protein n=3 Tax=Rhodosorus marinus TaxID=101924 RepID=A0A7S3EAP9_9RHOD|mmetsp:Transcript_21181/g.86504  ORF Transcript_21181/g.86504 Transcript_21181/m.86504 type:complete len:807 (+) Transcript_21181:428-2848(+)